MKPKKLVILAGVVALALTACGGGKGPKSGDWGNPVRIKIAGKNQETQTTFEMTLKDAWFTNYDGRKQFNSEDVKDKVPFMVIYYYKNLGPREGSLEELGPNPNFSENENKKVEIKTDKGHIYAGGNFYYSASLTEEIDTLNVGGWLPKKTTKIDETGESALVFTIPHDEIPTELIIKGLVDLDVKLPHDPFCLRSYAEVFGYLPCESENAVPGLIKALQYKNKAFEDPSRHYADYENKYPFCQAALQALAGIGPVAKDAVPTITNVLLNHENRQVRELAAKTLGEIGPVAKEAIPALRDPFQVSHPPNDNGTGDNQLIAAAQKAIAKIAPELGVGGGKGPQSVTQDHNHPASREAKKPLKDVKCSVTGKIQMQGGTVKVCAITEANGEDGKAIDSLKGKALVVIGTKKTDVEKLVGKEATLSGTVAFVRGMSINVDTVK